MGGVSFICLPQGGGGGGNGFNKLLKNGWKYSKRMGFFKRGAFSDLFKVIVVIFILPLRLLSTDLFEHIFILIPPQFCTGKSFQVAKVSSQSDGVTK